MGALFDRFDRAFTSGVFRVGRGVRDLHGAFIGQASGEQKWGANARVLYAFYGIIALALVVFVTVPLVRKHTDTLRGASLPSAAQSSPVALTPAPQAPAVVAATTPPPAPVAASLLDPVPTITPQQVYSPGEAPPTGRPAFNLSPDAQRISDSLRERGFFSSYDPKTVDGLLAALTPADREVLRAEHTRYFAALKSGPSFDRDTLDLMSRFASFIVRNESWTHRPTAAAPTSTQP